MGKNKAAFIIVGGLLGCGCLSNLVILAAILALFTIPKLSPPSEAEEMGVALDIVSQLNAAAAMYTAKNRTTPGNFTDFVSQADTSTSFDDPYTIYMGNVGHGGCLVSETVIDCADAFIHITAFYYWEDGVIRYEIDSR